MSKTYREVKASERLPKKSKDSFDLSDDVYAISKDGEMVIAYYDHEHKTWAGMFNYDSSIKYWLEEIELSIDKAFYDGCKAGASLKGAEEGQMVYAESWAADHIQNVPFTTVFNELVTAFKAGQSTLPKITEEEIQQYITECEETYGRPASLAIEIGICWIMDKLNIES